MPEAQFMTHILITLGFMVFAYLWGGIPVGYIVVKQIKGINILKYGSGNIGATNVRRVLGTGWFFGVLALDAVKGALPVLLAGLTPGFGSFESIFVAASTIGGNLFSPWLGFKGGKGIGTSLGAFLVLAPLSVLASIVVFSAALLTLNYMSIACIAGAIVFPFAILAAGFIRGTGHDPALLLFSAVLAITITAAERANIARVLNGTEPKFFTRPR
jgi:glycerol-3-phosphate acyltransferase PlsY